jgi:hypothetical protein
VSESEWPPSSNEMPDLGDRYSDTLLLQYIATSGYESLTPELHSFTVNIARLGDKAVREYRYASACLTAFVDAPGVDSVAGHTFLLRATDHLENCIDAIRRAEGFLSSRGFQSVSTPDQRDVLRKLHSGVRRLRNAIQHAERDIDNGRVAEGEPVWPAATTYGVFFAGKLVVYAELAALIVHLWELASAGVSAAAREDESLV